PTGVKDPFTLAGRVDEGMAYVEGDPSNLIATTGMIAFSCDLTICTLEFKNQVEDMHSMILTEGMRAAFPIKMVAFCFNVFGAVGGGLAGGGSVCVGVDSKGWGVYVTGAGGGGMGGGVSGSIQMSDGYLEDQSGEFYTGSASAWFIEGSGSSNGTIHTGGLGGGGGAGAMGGVSQTYVWRCCQWKIYKKTAGSQGRPG